MGDAAVLLDEDERVWKIVSGVFPSNCYIVGTGDTNRCAVIDPGLDGETIDAAIRVLGLFPAVILCTHGHFDHAGGAALLQRTYGCPVHLHEADRKALQSSNFLLMAFRIDARIELPDLTPLAENRMTVNVEGRTFSFHSTPGHTPGSCVIQSGNSLFTGDTLYAQGVGLSKLPGERPADLRLSIRSIFEKFPERLLAHPGHGESAQLGWIRDNNAALRLFLESTDEISNCS